MRDIILPFDKETELWILGVCLKDKAACHECMNVLDESDFHLPENSRLFYEMSLLHHEAKSITTSTLIHYLKEKGKLEEVGGAEKILLCEQVGLSSLDLQYYLKRLKSDSVTRQLLNLANQIPQRLQEKDVDQVINDLVSEINRIPLEQKSRFYSVAEISEHFKDGMSFIDYYELNRQKVLDGEDVFDGFRTGYPTVDNLMGGFKNGTNNVIGARSSSGKTTFVSNLMLNIAEKYPKAKIGMLTLEMDRCRMHNKILSILIGEPVSIFEEFNANPNELEKIKQGDKIFRKKNIYLYDKPGIKINQIPSLTMKQIIKDGLDIIFVDYMTIIKAAGHYQNKHLEIDEISKGLMALSRNFNIPIVTLCQLNRQASDNSEPSMGHLRESGSIEEDADTILLINRPGLSDSTIPDRTHLKVAKNRNRGDVGKTVLEYDQGRLFELTKEQQKEIEEMMKEREYIREKTFTPRKFQ